VRRCLVVVGMPEWLVEHLSRLFALVRDGALAEITETVRAVTGRDPRGFADFARDYAAAFGTPDTAAVP
jgi:hypothetical protein